MSVQRDRNSLGGNFNWRNKELSMLVMSSTKEVMIEDFFTLSEIKDGLTSQSRVEELVMIMQKERLQTEKNFAEAARQWTTVASALAATRSTDCLSLFIELNGLHYLNLWLQEFLHLSDKGSVFAMEESINVLLEALEKLPSSEEHVKSSGIAITIKQLCDHINPSIQSRARALFGAWNGDAVIKSGKADIEKVKTCYEAPSYDCSVDQYSVSTEERSIDDAKPADFNTLGTEQLNISGTMNINNTKKLDDGETLDSSLLDPGETFCSNRSDGFASVSELSERTTKLESVSGLCEQQSNVSQSNCVSSDKSESSDCHMEASLSVRGGNEPVEEATGDDNLLPPNSGLKADTKVEVSNEIASKSDGAHDCEVGDAQQSTQSQSVTHETEPESRSWFGNSEKCAAAIGHMVRTHSGNISSMNGTEDAPSLSSSFPGRIDKDLLSVHNIVESEDCALEKTVDVTREPRKPVSDFDLNEEMNSTDALGTNPSACGPISDSSHSGDSSHITTGGQDSNALLCERAYMRHDPPDFDLNVADDATINNTNDTIVIDQIPASSLRSSESYIEVSSRGANRRGLDLNCLADEIESSSDVADRKELGCNLDQFQNPPIISSSSGRSSKINFDLNESLYLEDDRICGAQNNDGNISYQVTGSQAASSWYESAIILTGSRVRDDRCKVALSSSNSLNLWTENPRSPCFLSRPEVSVHLPDAAPVASPCSYSGFPLGPSISSSCFRGSESVSYTTNSTGVGIASPYAQPFLFLIDENHGPVDTDTVRPSKSRCSQNAELMTVERRNSWLDRSGAEAKQYTYGQCSTAQYPTSSTGAKRKEPDDGLQTHQPNFRRQHTWI